MARDIFKVILNTQSVRLGILSDVINLYHSGTVNPEILGAFTYLMLPCVGLVNLVNNHMHDLVYLNTLCPSYTSAAAFVDSLNYYETIDRELYDLGIKNEIRSSYLQTLAYHEHMAHLNNSETSNKLYYSDCKLRKLNKDSLNCEQIKRYYGLYSNTGASFSTYEFAYDAFKYNHPVYIEEKGNGKGYVSILTHRCPDGLRKDVHFVYVGDDSDKQPMYISCFSYEWLLKHFYNDNVPPLDENKVKKVKKVVYLSRTIYENNKNNIITLQIFCITSGKTPWSESIKSIVENKIIYEEKKHEYLSDNNKSTYVKIFNLLNRRKK